MSASPKMKFHYCPDQNKDELEVFEMEDDFLISFTDFYDAILKRPVMGKSLGFIPYRKPFLTEDELKQALLNMKKRAGLPEVLVQDEPVLEHRPIPNSTSAPTFFQRLASFFRKQ
jgi:hypothetical protein